MTEEEKKEYNKLNSKDKAAYNFYKGQHPEWAHNQVIAMVVIMREVNIGPEPPSIKDILLAAVKKADEFLEREFPRVYSAVKGILGNIYNKLKNALKVAWEEIVSWFS